VAETRGVGEGRAKEEEKKLHETPRKKNATVHNMVDRKLVIYGYTSVWNSDVKI